MPSEIIKTAAVVILKGDQTLLVRHGSGANHYEGVYGLTGGKLETEETEIQTATREMNEETGLQPIGELIDFPDSLFFAEIEMKDGITRNFSWKVFLCNNFEGNLKKTEETEPLWVNINELDKYAPLLPNVKTAIEKAYTFL